MQARASVLDQSATFPDADVAELRDTGALLGPFPTALGGLGLGCEPEAAQALARLLRALGRGNLAVGRLYEAHVNAVRLISRYGTRSLLQRAAADASEGYLFGLWVTDPSEGALQVASAGILSGDKAFCSGAGTLARAVVTIGDTNGATRLAYLSTNPALATQSAARLQGMRAATTGFVAFDGQQVTADDWIGAADDYLREPDFSAGAWRTLAVICGGLEALVALAMRQLVERGRAGDLHQQVRMGRSWVAQETALLWLARAAEVAEANDSSVSSAHVTATVNFARTAIEAACLEAMTLVERSIGLAAFQQSNPLERLRRDLGTYLRQPAPDEALTEAAAHIMQTRFRGP
jgi:hypothetical protein